MRRQSRVERQGQNVIGGLRSPGNRPTGRIGDRALDDAPVAIYLRIQSPSERVQLSSIRAKRGEGRDGDADAGGERLDATREVARLLRSESVKLIDPLVVERLVANPENLRIHHGFSILARRGSY